MTEPKPEGDPRKHRKRSRIRKTSQLLRVYRHVFKTHQPKYKNGKPMKEHPNVALIREIKEKKPDQFIAKMQEMEAEYARSRGEEGEAAQMDEGSRKVLELVEQLLDDIQAKAQAERPHQK